MRQEAGGFFVVSVVLGLLSTGSGASQDIPPMPMPIPFEDTIQHRWLDKPVLAGKLLDDMESLDNWSHEGFGQMSLTSERAKDGKQSLRLTSPTLGDKPGGTLGRPFGGATVTRRFNGEDWTGFNRLSFWVYPTLPGFRVISMCVVFHNDGREKVPDSYGRNGLNFVLLEPDRWNHVVCEIAHLGRDKVTGVEFQYRLQGNEPVRPRLFALTLTTSSCRRWMRTSSRAGRWPPDKSLIATQAIPPVPRRRRSPRIPRARNSASSRPRPAKSS